MMTYDYYQDYNPINIIVMFISTFQFLQTLENALETEAQFCFHEIETIFSCQTENGFDYLKQ